MERMKILKCYPFERSALMVELVETFGGYTGTLGDDPTKVHRGTDYIWKNEIGVFAPFKVFSAHDGIAFQGKSNSWGNFVKVYKDIGKHIISTIYAHLRDIPGNIPILPETKKERKNRKGLKIKPDEFLGNAWTSGWTNGIPQLHFELQIKEIGSKGEEGKWQKFDPYGIKKKIDCKEYPQPGQSLSGLEHYWTSDNPRFANEVWKGKI